MATSFPRTLVALRTDRARGALFAGVVAGFLLAGWCFWLFGARVAVYRTSARARLEVSPAPARVAAEVSGRVVAVDLSVGMTVAAGTVLLELDTAPERMALARTRAQVATLEREGASIARELAAEGAASASGEAVDLATLRESVAHARAAEAALLFAQEEETRARTLVEMEGAPKAALSRASRDLHQKRAARAARSHSITATEGARRQREARDAVRREQLDRQLLELDSKLAAMRTEVARITYEIERRSIRAPVAGTLGEVASLRPGSVVAAGEVIATVVPVGELQVVASYLPTSIGRIAVGQRAQVRLDGFPWTHYGTVAARVTRVGDELRDGMFRVDLAPTHSARIALRHGMTGSVDVEVERVSPFALLARYVGRPGDDDTRRD